MDGSQPESQLALFEGQQFEGDGHLPYNPWRLDRAERERGLQGVARVRRALRQARAAREEAERRPPGGARAA